MNTSTAQKHFVVYRYQPTLPSYFDQTEIIEFDHPPTEDEMYAAACNQNNCKESEVEIIDVFKDKKLLHHYLKKNGLGYLI